MKLRLLRYILLAGLAIVTLQGCVYRMDIPQGNRIDPALLDRLEMGMTRNQVRYILGTPVVDNLFRDDRWDYVYYFRAGRSKKPERRWLVVWFEEDTVIRVDRDLIQRPAAAPAS